MTAILLIGGAAVSSHALLIVFLGVPIVVRIVVLGYCELSSWWRPFCIVCELSNIVAWGVLYSIVGFLGGGSKNSLCSLSAFYMLLMTSGSISGVC